MDKLFTEKIGSAWIFVKEGVERSEEIESSLIEAESGFDPPDCNNDLPIHSNFSLDPIKQSSVLFKTLLSFGNCRRCDEKGPIKMIGFGLPLLVH